MVQDAPPLTGVTITVASLARLHESNPLICAVKLEGIPSAAKTSEALDRLDGRMSVFSGWGVLRSSRDSTGALSGACLRQTSGSRWPRSTGDS